MEPIPNLFSNHSSIVQYWKLNDLFQNTFFKTLIFLSLNNEFCLSFSQISIFLNFLPQEMRFFWAITHWILIDVHFLTLLWIGYSNMKWKCWKKLKKKKLPWLFLLVICNKCQLSKISSPKTVENRPDLSANQVPIFL